LREHLRFLRRFVGDPRSVGAVAPSGTRLARAMAAQTDPAANGPVLELGPGTGVVTAALIARGLVPERITAIEYDHQFAAALRRDFPGVRVITGDAFRLYDIVGEACFTAIISSLPLLNFPIEMRRKFIVDAMSHLLPGAPFIQFSYGLAPPVQEPQGACVKLGARVWRNLPPAKVWVYRRLRI
jgi:phosphatidylethanolamine/phosphatidyl-N-methylethanolamine N-methyltransferase